MEHYIEWNIIRPLNDALSDEWGLELYTRESIYRALTYCKRQGTKGEGGLASAMHPLYEKFFFAHHSVHGVGARGVWEIVSQVLQEDHDFYGWVEMERNLLDSAHAWAQHQKIEQAYNPCYPHLLRTIAATFYSYSLYITQEDIDEAKNILVRERVEGNPYSREIYCMYYAFIAIWNEYNLSSTRKEKLFSLVVDEWHIVRHLFSAMLQCVVGTGRTEFAAIIHDVRVNHRQHPYAHLLYAAVTEHKERIVQNGTKRDKLDKALEALREAISGIKPSHELDEMVAILFSDRLKEYLERHQPKSYHELEIEVQSLREGMDERTARIQVLMSEQAEMLRQMVSIDAITEELLRLPVGTAYGVYEKLNSLLQTDEVWRKNADVIRERVLKKEQSAYTQLNINAPVATLVAHAEKIVNEN